MSENSDFKVEIGGINYKLDEKVYNLILSISHERDQIFNYLCYLNEIIKIEDETLKKYPQINKIKDYIKKRREDLKN